MIIQVREYALLTCDKTQPASMDLGIVSEATFSWLEQLPQNWGGSAQILSREGKQFLRLGSYVGYLQSPDGEAIEILPKTAVAPPLEAESLRLLLRRMLCASMRVTPREADLASLKRSNQPLHEWIIGEFLRHLTDLVRRGLRFDYHLIEDENSAFIRGQLNVTAQMRQPLGRGAQFHVRYAEFSPQRLENRLLRTALEWVLKVTRLGPNWRRANSLSHQLDQIEPIRGSIMQAVDQWSNGKTLYGYRAIKPWCQLILEKLNPDFQQGGHQGISLLFPMPALYECWVGSNLDLILQRDYQLITQAKRHYLLEHHPAGADKSQKLFMLKPDFLVTGQQLAVLDTKWKLLEGRAIYNLNNYAIDEADLYQMFAYGQKYLKGNGNMMLIYPSHSGFDTPLSLFRFDENLSLWCIPFDLDSGRLVDGEWRSSFPCFTTKSDTEAIAQSDRPYS